YNPWVSLYWMVTGKTVGGLAMYDDDNLLDREEALRLYTEGSSWFSGENGEKGQIAKGKLADLAVLSKDYFTVPDEEIKSIEALLTMVNGKVVYAVDEFASHAPPQISIEPDWAPVKAYGGYGAPLDSHRTNKGQEIHPDVKMPCYHQGYSTK